MTHCSTVGASFGALCWHGDGCGERGDGQPRGRRGRTVCQPEGLLMIIQLADWKMMEGSGVNGEVGMALDNEKDICFLLWR